MEPESAKKTGNSKSARSYALSLVARRAYSSAKLRAKLIQKSYGEKEIDDCIRELQSYGLIDDRLYAQAKVKTWIQRGYSRRLIDLQRFNL